MKVYFAGSIRGGRNDKALYLELIDYLSQFGQVLTEHVGFQNLSEFGEEGPTDEWIFNRDVSWIVESDVIIAEVTTPSLGVGYEIAKAESLGKPILCLYRPQDGKRLSAMIAGNIKANSKHYKNLEEAKEVIGSFFDSL
ncbi:MAG: nucleoside 2-deoxyribosyltransferase [Chitinophagales bacterium]